MSSWFKADIKLTKAFLSPVQKKARWRCVNLKLPVVFQQPSWFWVYMVEEPGPAEAKRSVVGFYHYLQNFLSHQMGERQVHWNYFNPGREPDRPEQGLSWLLPWFPWIQTGFLLQVLRKEVSRKVKLQAGRGRLVARTSNPYMVLSSSHLQTAQSCSCFAGG